jgi:predicted amidohydrolase
MRVAAVQHDIVWEDPPANHARLAPLIAAAAAGGASLVVLAEMFASGFTMATDRVAEGPDGPTIGFLREQAAGHHVAVCGSVAVRDGGASRPGNDFVLARPDGEIRRYRKIHPFSFAGEDQHYQAGERVSTWELAGVRVTPFVCYDLRFADGFWGAGPATDVYVVVANWPASRQHHWRSLVVARAIENQAYVVAVNRVGQGGGLSYVGGSCVVGPGGEVVADAGADETTVFADVEPDRVAAVRAEFPFLADRAERRDESSAVTTSSSDRPH